MQHKMQVATTGISMGFNKVGEVLGPKIAGLVAAHAGDFGQNAIGSTLLKGTEIMTTNMATSAISSMDFSAIGKKNFFDSGSFTKGAFGKNAMTSVAAGMAANYVSSTMSSKNLTTTAGNILTGKTGSFNVKAIQAFNSTMGNLASTAVTYGLTGNAKINVLNANMFGGKLNGGLFEIGFGKDGSYGAFGMGGTDFSAGTLMQSYAGYKESQNVESFKYGSKNDQVSLETIAMYDHTKTDVNNKLAQALAKRQANIELTDGIASNGTEYNGMYDGDKSKNTIFLNQDLIGAKSLEDYAKIASVVSHEGVHMGGDKVEADAYAVGGVTYAQLVQNMNLKGDVTFMNGIVAALGDSKNYQANGAGADFWKVMEDGSLAYDGDGWLKDSNGNFILDENGKQIGSQGIQTGLQKILGLNDTQAVAMLKQSGFNMNSDGTWKNGGNVEKSITKENGQYNSYYEEKLDKYNTLTIYNTLVAQGKMDQSYNGTELMTMSYAEYKKNNFIQSMPMFSGGTPVPEGSSITTLFGVSGNISSYPHRGIDFGVANECVYPFFSNDTTTANIFESVQDLLSAQGRHVDLTTDVTYMFKGQQRTDTILQRFLHLDSSSIASGMFVDPETLLGVSGNTGSLNGSGYPLHLHTDVSADQSRSPWLDYLASTYDSKRMKSYTYSSGDKRVYYDPMIFIKQYNYNITSGASNYNK